MPIKVRRLRPRPKPLKKYDGPLRDTMLDRARKVYREKKADTFELVNCLRSLNYFEEKSEFRPVSFGGSGTIVTMPVHKVTEVAELLEKSYQTFWRWTKDDAIVPPPILTTHGQGRSITVYHRDEVRALIQIIGEHEKAFAYYRNDHVITKKKLFDQIETIRANIIKEFENAGSEKSSSPVRSRLKIRPRPGQGGRS